MPTDRDKEFALQVLGEAGIPSEQSVFEMAHDAEPAGAGSEAAALSFMSDLAPEEHEKLIQAAPVLAQRAPVPKASSGGAMGTLKRAGRKAEGIRSESRKSLDAVHDEALRALEVRRDVGLQEAEIEDRIETRRSDLAEQRLAQQAERQSLAKQLFEEKKTKMAEMHEISMTRADPDEYRRHKEIVNSDFSTAAEKEKSREWMKDQKTISMGPKIGALIALAVFGRSKLGGIVDVLTNLVNQDVSNQREAFRRNRQAFTDLGKYYDGAFKSLGDHGLAQDATWVAAGEATLAEMDKAKAGIKDDAVLAKFEENKVALLEKMELKQAEISEKMANSAISEAGKMATIQMGVADQKAGLAAAQMKAHGERKGKTIGTADVRSIGEMEAADKMLVDLATIHTEKASGPLGGISQYAPGTSEKEYNDTRSVAAQTIGGIIEGGKLTESDFDRYYDMLPSPGDSDRRAKNKIDQIRKLLSAKRKGGIAAFEKAGYDASGFQPTEKGARADRRVKQ